MKKFLFSVAIAAFALVACETSNTDVDGSGGVNDGNGGNTTAVKVEGVIFNELCGNKVYNGNKFIELLNNTESEQTLTGWTIRKYASDATDVSGKYNICWTGPEGKTLAAGAYLVLGADKADPNEGFNAGLSAKKELKFELVNPEGTVVDTFLRGVDADPFAESELPENKEDSFSRVPNGTNVWAYAEPTPGAANGEATGTIEHDND